MFVTVCLLLCLPVFVLFIFRFSHIIYIYTFFPYFIYFLLTFSVFHSIHFFSLHAVSICSCYLRTNTHFIWALICPVVFIFIANIGFAIVIARVIWQHPKKDSKKQNIRSWLKFSVSLPVVMGLTWVPGLFVINHKGVIPLAYISTFLVASQGTLIFLIFIVFFKPVRVAYATLLRSKVRKSYILSKYFGDLDSAEMVRNGFIVT